MTKCLYAIFQGTSIFPQFLEILVHSHHSRSRWYFLELSAEIWFEKCSNFGLWKSTKMMCKRKQDECVYWNPDATTRRRRNGTPQRYTWILNTTIRTRRLSGLQIHTVEGVLELLLFATTYLCAPRVITKCILLSIVAWTVGFESCPLPLPLPKLKFTD